MDDFVVFHLGEKAITLVDLVLAGGTAASAVIISLAISRLLNRYRQKHNISFRFTRFVKQASRIIIALIAFSAISSILHISPKSVMEHTIYSNERYSFKILNLLVILVILFLTRFIVFIIEYLVDLRIQHRKMDKGRGKSFLQILKYLIWAIGLAVMVSSLGFNMTLVIASVSALLVGVGFGLQHIFNDFFSGIIILFDGSIEVDDVVEVDGVVGRVLSFGLRAAQILTRDNVVIIVPNSRFTNDRVINWSHNKEVTRFHVNVGVAYGSDVRLVERILLVAANQHHQIVSIPKPFVRFNDFGESSLDFQLYFWTANDFLVENIKSDLRFVIDDEFRKNKVEIPFPQRDLHLKSKNFE